MTVAKINAGDGVVRFGPGRFFFEAQDTPVRVEFYHAIAFRVFDRIAEDLAAGF